MTALLALLRNDLVLYFSNRRALLMGIVVPIAIAAFFGSLFGNTDSKPSRVPLAVTDLDRSALSIELVRALRGDAALDVQELPTEQAEAVVKSGKVAAALTVPAGFGAQAGKSLFTAQHRPELALRIDPSQGMALQLIRGLLAQHAMQVVGKSVFSLSGDSPRFLQDVRASTLKNTGLDTPSRDALLALFDSVERVQRHVQPASAPAAGAEAASAAPAPAGFGMQLPYALKESEAGAGPEVHYNSYAHAFAGMGVQFILFMGIDLGIGLLAMRRLDLWKRLRAAPLTKTQLLASRIASGAVTALVLLACMYAAAIAVFGVRVEGSWVGFFGVAVAFAVMTSSFGLLIAALGRTPEATRPLAIFVTLMLVMLGGAWVPAFVFPEWLQQVSLFAPTRWAVDGLDAMTWRGLGLHAALAPIGVMLATAAVCALVAAWRFGWDE